MPNTFYYSLRIISTVKKRQLLWIQKLRMRQLAFFCILRYLMGFAAFFQIHLQIQIVGSKSRIQFSVITRVRYFISVVVWTSIYYCRLRMCFWRKCEHSSQSSISLVSGLGQSWFPASLKVPFPSFPASERPEMRRQESRKLIATLPLQCTMVHY